MASSVPVSSGLAVTAVGPGAAVDFTTAKMNVSMVIVVAGTVTGGLVALEASHDGTNWVSHTVVEPMTGLNVGLDNRAGAYRYWRSNVLAEITGGGSVSTSFMEAG